MFEALGDRLEGVIKKVKGYGKISESNIDEMMREIRLALLEADVNFKVVKEFTKKVKEAALGESVKKSLNPGEQFLKILKDELVILLGTDTAELDLTKKPLIIMLAGLQGSGKTTTAGKLGLFLRKNHKKNPLFIAADIYRPAAIDQLVKIGNELTIDVYEDGKKDPAVIVENGLEYAKENNNDVIIIDTAGRLHIDENLMGELNDIKNVASPHEIILVIDSMMGQDAINVITGFNEKLPLTGAILTKLDSDTKGGVALSVRHLTNIPIKFIGTSEKMDGLTSFVPERMASRILDMGDMLSVLEKAESVIDQDMAKDQAKKFQKGKFTLEDFLIQLKQIKKLGPLENVIKMLPGARKMGLNNVNVDPKKMARIEAIILSMTISERKAPEIIKASRKQRIAKGSGTRVEDVNRMLKQFEEMKKMLKMMKNKNFKDMPF